MLCSDTPFLIEKHVSRTGIRCGGYDSHSATPFREKQPVSRARGRRKRLMRCSDTPFHKQKPVSRARGRRNRRTEATPHCTTRYDHPTKPQNHKTTTHHPTKPHHIISHHITTISKPDNTTNRQNPIPCLKHHTLQHYTTKALPSQKLEEELY